MASLSTDERLSRDVDGFLAHIEKHGLMSEEQLQAMNKIPRRICIDKFTPAEKAIYDAVHVVETMAADPRLTEAVILLQKARDWVADFADGIDTTRYFPYTDVIRPKAP